MIQDAQHIHMVGAGGIGMSALAQLLMHRGKQVSGSDRDSSPVTEMLAKKGMKVTIGHGTVPEGTELLIYSDALKEDNLERRDAKEKNIPQLSLFEANGEISKEYFTITVTGTHGKTTTTGMLGKVLIDLGVDPTVIVGSIMKDLGSNFRAGNSNVLVIEGCEYMGHVMKLNTNILVLNNVELDHPDYFKSLEEIQKMFKDKIASMPQEGIVVTDVESQTIKPVIEGASQTIIDFASVPVPELSVLGEFNTLNAKAAKAAALAYDGSLSEEKIDTSLSSFQGTWRRFEKKGKTKSGALVYDDYAHHPTAVRGAIEAARKHFPNKRLVVAFHPHLHSRTETFFDEFAEELSKADEVILAPIYKARNENDYSVTSGKLAEAVQEKGTEARSFEDLPSIQAHLEEYTNEGDLVLFMGAGDIYKVADSLVKAS